MKQNSIKNTPLYGINIYRDKNSRAIYRNPFTKKAYIIDKNKENLFRTLQSRFVIGIVVFTLFKILSDLNVFISIGFGILAWFIMELRFHKLLKNSRQVQFDKQELRPSTKFASKNLSRKELIIRIFVYLSFSVILIINAHISGSSIKENPVWYALNYAVSIGGLYFVINYIILLSKKPR